MTDLVMLSLGRAAEALSPRRNPDWRLRGLRAAVVGDLSIYRAWMNQRLGEVEPGKVLLDAGGGGSKTTDLLRSRPHAVVTIDIRPEVKPTLQADLEGRLPLQACCVDTILILNVLEHVTDYRSVLSESARVLRPGGQMHLCVPFFYPRHTARLGEAFIDDNYRFGPGTLTRLIMAAGFSTVELEVCGFGPFTASSNAVASVVPSRWLRGIVKIAGVVVDRVMHRYWTPLGRSAPNEWPLGFWITARL